MIRNPDRFNQAKPAGFDGIFDWDWTRGCFGSTSIEPMDIDACVERRGQFLMFETKDAGVEVKEGQMITLRRFRGLGCVTLIFIVGKACPPELAVVWYPGTHELDPEVDVEHFTGIEPIRDFIKRWFAWASDGSPARPPFTKRD